MVRREGRTSIAAVADRLRSSVLEAGEGVLIGSEEALVEQLGCSRSTVRQVARMLEREGLLQVRRGSNGGYFSARPNAATIEAAVSAYLATLEMDAQDVTTVASTLWVEAVRKAASMDAAMVAPVVARLRSELAALPANAAFEAISDLELKFQGEIFRLANSAYIKLIFDINLAFSRHHFPPVQSGDGRASGEADFLRVWTAAKLQELNAIEIRDVELAALAARYSRRIWHARVWQRLSAGAKK
jgi:DNA-binding GntR family transcriptional regulator